MGMKYPFFSLLASLSVIAHGVATSLPSRQPRADSSSYTSDAQFRQTMLDVHNQYRADHNVGDLQWNDTLADVAFNWARTCDWEHSGSGFGENLSMGYPTASEAVKAWGDERDHYDFNKPTGFTERTGHFTQMVWKDTTEVGCGRVNCGIDHDDDDDRDDDDAQGWYVVCEYWPPGNVAGGDNYKSNVQASSGGGAKAGDSETGEQGRGGGIGGTGATGGAARLKGCAEWSIAVALLAVLFV